MPSFLEIKSGDWTVKALFVSVAIVLVGGVLTIYYETAGTSGRAGDIAIKCVSEGCTYSAAITPEEFKALSKVRETEFREKIKAENPDWSPQQMLPGMMGMPGGMQVSPEMVEELILFPWGNPGYPLICSVCGNETLYKATKCENCGEIFMPNHEERYADKCKCGYSKMEERAKERKARKAKKKK